MNQISPFLRASLTRDGNRRAADKLFPARDSRAEFARRELEEAAAAKDANTARLRALRLEKEVREAQAANASCAPPSEDETGKKTTRRIVCP